LTSWQRGLFVLAGCLGLALGVACELVVGVDELSDRKCALDEKRCADRCVPRSSPETGCNGLSCAPCVLPNASARCENGECVVASCNEGYDDCDPLELGCETDLVHDPNHCSDCNYPKCETPHGKPACSEKRCATGGCDVGWWDCNREWQDGCETDLTTTSDCGACRNVCAPGTACVGGACV
jgi:hypothetical protein